MEKKLNELLKFYRDTGDGWEILESGIAVKVYFFPRGKEYCSEEDCAGFYLSFYPRIRSIIFRYRDVGKNFEAYLHTCLYWHLKTYLRQKIQGDRKERLLLRETVLEREAEAFDGRSKFSDRFLSEPAKPASLSDCRIRGRGWSKRLLLLTLKSAMFLGDQNLEHLAILTGMHRDFLFHLIEILRFTMRRRFERISKLSARRNRNYFRLQCLREEKHRCLSKERLETIDRLIEKEQQRYDRTSNDLSRVPKTPTHREIARLLGLPKGSIDSGLYYLRKIFSESEDPRFSRDLDSGMVSP